MNISSQAGRWWEIFLYQTYCQLRLESERLYIGYLWWGLETVLEMALLYAIFHSILAVPGEHYLSFLLCGLVCWRWFAQSVTRAAPSILQNQPLATQVFVPKLLFPLATLSADAVKSVVGLVVLAAFLHLDGLSATTQWWAFPLVLGTQFLFLSAAALWVAALVPFLRSILVGMEVALRFGMFLSGVFFDLDRVGQPLRGWLELNPMAVILNAWRDVLMRAEWPNFSALGLVALCSLIAIAAAGRFVQQRELLYPRLPA